MRRFVLVVVAVVACWMMAGCVVGQKIPLTYTPEQMDATQGVGTFPLSVTVADNRPYVASGDKGASFIGKYRSGFGIPYDVNTEGKTPLAQAIQRDLTADIRKAGFTVVPSATAERWVEVSILDYNFDCYQNCRVWIRLEMQVRDASGTVLYSKDLVDDREISGGAFGPKYVVEEEIPKRYGAMIRNIVRGDAEAMAALKRPDDVKK